MKFGGTSLENPHRIKQAAKIVARLLEGNKIALVVSALGDTTDLLSEIGEAAHIGESQKLKKLQLRLRSLHVNAARAVPRGDQSRKLATTVGGLLSELDGAVHAVLSLRELTPRSRDYILSFGERLSAPIVTAGIQALGIRGRTFTGAEAGITTDDNFGEARPLVEVSYHQIRRRLELVWGEEGGSRCGGIHCRFGRWKCYYPGKGRIGLHCIVARGRLVG